MEPEVAEDQSLNLELAQLLLSPLQASGQRIKKFVGELLGMNMGVQMPFLTGGIIEHLTHLMSTESVSLMECLVITSGPMLLV